MKRKIILTAAIIFSTVNSFVSAQSMVGIQGPSSACVGDTVGYSATMITNATYAWTHTSGLHYIYNFWNVAWFNIVAAGTDTVFVTVTDSSGTSSAYRKVTSAVMLPTPSVVQSNDTLMCTVSGNMYLWYKNTIQQPLYTQSIVITPSQNDLWTVWVCMAPTCWSVSAPFQTSVGIEETTAANAGVTLVPNPVTTEFRINTDGFIIKEVEVYNVLGNKVYENSFTQSINVSAWSNGIYFVRIKSDDGIKSLKVLVQH
jgi:hypothetical protein